MHTLTYKKVFKRIFIIILITTFNSIFENAPLSLALLPGLLLSGCSPIFALIVFFAVSFFSFNFSSALLIFASSVFICLVFYLYKRNKKQMHFEQTLYLCIALIPYCFGNFSGYLTQKLAYSAVICILSIVLSQGLNLIFIKKFNKKAEREQVIAFYISTVFFTLGLINLISVSFVYLLSVFTLLLFCYFYKSQKTYTVALILSLPFAIHFKNLTAIAIFEIYCATALLFIKKSKLLATLCTIAVQTAYLFLSGGFTAITPLRLFYYFAPFTLFLFTPLKLLIFFENAFKKFDEPEIIRDIINEERAELSAKLFNLSNVFQNLNCSLQNFNKLILTKEELIQKIYDETIFSVCSECEFYDKCYKKNKSEKEDVKKLINVGINKGKVNLIDLSRDFSSYCYLTNSIIFTVNKLLEEYQLEVQKLENSTKCKQLVSLQANGVSEVLKNLAYEFSQKIEFNRKKELEIFDYFAVYGILLNQVLKVGESYHLLFPKAKTDFSFAQKLLSTNLGKNMRLTSKTDVGNCILAKFSPAPKFDACFGIAQKTKDGSNFSGDTHTLTKIDENNFIVALCDGMGSGEMAFNNSKTAISLIEAFFRAKLEKQSCMELTNKMISLCSNDSFCAVDLIAIDLENASVEILKIGAPIGFLITESGVKVIENSSLPLGVLEEISPTTYSLKLNDGDTFILLSDGITDAFFSSTDTVDFLEKEKCLNPQILAEKLLNYALEIYEGQAKDDMSAVVVKVYKTKENSQFIA